MEQTQRTTYIFLETPELEKQGLLIGLQEDKVLFPTLVILRDGGKITWDTNGQFTMISMESLTWTLVILRRYATDIQLLSQSKSGQQNTARQLIFSPQTFVLLTGTSENTGTQLDFEPIIVSGGESVQCSVKRVMTQFAK